MHLSEEIWIQVSKLFNWDYMKRKPGYFVVVAGFGRRLLPVQAHAAWHTLMEINGIVGSLFLGHIMGIGKTTMVLVVHHIQRTVNYMRNHIKNNPQKHLPSTNTDPNALCPCNVAMLKQFGFDCPCALSSPTYFIKERLGINSALVPVGLLDTWELEFGECFPKLRNGSPNPVSLVRAHGPKIIPQKLINKMIGREEKFTDHEGNPDASIYHPRLENSDVFVISTGGSFESKFLNVFSKQNHWTYQPQGVPAINSKGQEYITQPHSRVVGSKTFQTAVLSIQVRDEFQLERGQNADSVKAMTEAKRRQRPQHGYNYPINYVVMSGTPLETGPLDVAEYIKIMATDEWMNDDLLRHWVHDEAIDMGTRWEKHCTGKRDPETAKQIIELFTPLMERMLLRFTAESDFLGFPPVIHPTNRFKQFECDNGPEWNARVEKLRADEDARIKAQEDQRFREWRRRHPTWPLSDYEPLKKNRPNAYFRARICATFPALMDLTDENGMPLRLTEQEVQERTSKNPPNDATRWELETDSDPYFTNLDQIIASSGKINGPGGVFNQITQWKDKIDAEGKQVRQIWTSYFYVVAYIQYLVSIIPYIQLLVSKTNCALLVDEVYA
jgi:hypothetical protein